MAGRGAGLDIDTVGAGWMECGSGGEGEKRWERDDGRGARIFDFWRAA